MEENHIKADRCFCSNIHDFSYDMNSNTLICHVCGNYITLAKAIDTILDRVIKIEEKLG